MRTILQNPCRLETASIAFIMMSSTRNAERRGVSFFRSDKVISHQGGRLFFSGKCRPRRDPLSPVPKPLPQKSTGRKKKYPCLSAGSNQDHLKGNLIKRTKAEKPRMFRTLIKLMHTGRKPAQKGFATQAAGPRVKREAWPPFFRRVNRLSLLFDEGGDFLELKSILALALCLVIAGSGVFLCISRGKRNNRGRKEEGIPPFLSA